jgi:hypothetical protein
VLLVFAVAGSHICRGGRVRRRSCRGARPPLASPRRSCSGAWLSLASPPCSCREQGTSPSARTHTSREDMPDAGEIRSLHTPPPRR